MGGETVPAEVFFQTDAKRFWDQTKSISFLVTADGYWHRYVIKVGTNNSWVNNKIYQVRLDIGGMNRNVDVDLIRISSKPELTYDFNVDGIFNRDDLEYGVPPLFNVSASQSDPKNIKLQTVIGSLNYLK